MWGQAHIGNHIRKFSGIIPTRVGTRKSCHQWVTVIWDHPHACGDKLTLTLQSICQIGSSPRVWGQDCCKYNFNPILRIIPTRVGTSIISFRPEGRERDHPHACGDKFEVFPLVSLSIGSSPRVWGQAEGVPSRFIVYRIIPTRVGTS